MNKLIEELNAGGNDPEKFDWLEAWYPIYYVEDLDRTKPQRFTLLDQDLVIWWDKAYNNWRVFPDQCPHRLATLSEGRINQEGYLECPYHGWSFDGNGQCQSIPQQLPDKQEQKSPRACLTPLPSTIQQDLLFVYPGNPERAALTKVPIVEPMEENPQDWICLNIFRDLPYDALTLMENVLDSSHLPFTHHRSVGNRANAAPVELEVSTSSKDGFTGIWEEGPRKGKLGKQYTTFIAPGLMWHDLTSKQFGRTMTVVYATPIGKGKCRLFARFPFQFASPIPKFFIKLSPRWYSHLGQNRILEDDQIFLHYQERYLEAKGGSENFAQAFYLPTRADLFVIELRKWVNRYSIDPFPHQKLYPPVPKEVLLDRYHSHTSNCASCSKALKRIQQVQHISSIVFAIGLLAIAYSHHLGLAILTALAGITWESLRRLQKDFYQGQDTPARNMYD